jgi:hypothetical protein
MLLEINWRFLFLDAPSHLPLLDMLRNILLLLVVVFEIGIETHIIIMIIMMYRSFSFGSTIQHISLCFSLILIDIKKCASVIDPTSTENFPTSDQIKPHSKSSCIHCHHLLPNQWYWFVDVEVGFVSHIMMI